MSRAAYVKLPRLLKHWPVEAREMYEERAGIKEFEGGMDRNQAEREADAEVRLWHKAEWMEGDKAR